MRRPSQPRPSAQATRRGAIFLSVVGALSAVALSAAPAQAGKAAGAGAVTPSYPVQTTLTNDKIGHWAVVVRRATAHRLPNIHSKAVTVLSTVTGDGTQNLVLILDQLDLNASKTWYRVRLAILPNNSTGWVQANALGSLYVVHTHLYIDRETETAVLKKNGKTIFTTRVGVGRTYWPTPRGQFYIRDKLTNFHDPFYGPLAFGTSARSAVLTEWPGGGYIGVHGTDAPELIPGHISHGCIRVVNSQILKLAHLLQVGSPLTIT
jgi:hypothetical protein